MARWCAFETYTIDTILADHRGGAERQARAMWGAKVLDVRARLTGPSTLSGRYDVLGERVIGELEAGDLLQAAKSARYAWGDRVTRVQSLVSLEAAQGEYRPIYDLQGTDERI